MLKPIPLLDCCAVYVARGFLADRFTHGHGRQIYTWTDDDLLPSPEKKISKPKHTRLKFDFEKLKDPNVLETFQAMIGGKFAPLKSQGGTFPC